MSTHIKMITFLTLGITTVFGWHFATVFGILGSAPTTQGEFFLRIAVIFIGFLIISAITAALIASRDEQAVMPDEREEKIELKAERVGLVVLYTGLLIVAWFVFTPLEPMQVANALLAVVCIAELLKLLYALFILKKRI